VPVAFTFVKLPVPVFSVKIFPVVPLNVTVLVVVAFVVLAFKFAKFPVVPQIVPMIAEVICAKTDEKPVEVVVAVTDKF
jgi:hypothetical protein